MRNGTEQDQYCAMPLSTSPARPSPPPKNIWLSRDHFKRVVSCSKIKNTWSSMAAKKLAHGCVWSDIDTIAKAKVPKRRPLPYKQKASAQVQRPKINDDH
eukprot:scaffold470_cov72-Skeletonema_dohrnii-CCMP3373.AAC.4